MEILVGFFVGISVLAISVAIYDWGRFGTLLGKRRGKKRNINKKGSRGPGKTITRDKEKFSPRF